MKLEKDSRLHEIHYMIKVDPVQGYRVEIYYYIKIINNN